MGFYILKQRNGTLIYTDLADGTFRFIGDSADQRCRLDGIKNKY